MQTRNTIYGDWLTLKIHNYENVEATINFEMSYQSEQMVSQRIVYAYTI